MERFSRVSALIIGPPGRWRSSLCVLLQANPELDAVDQANDHTAGLRKIAESPPAIVFVDGGLPDDEPWQALQGIKSSWPQVRCVMLVHDSAQAQRTAKMQTDAMLQVGFSGEALYATVHDLLMPDPNP